MRPRDFSQYLKTWTRVYIVPVWIALKPALGFVSCIFSFLFFFFFLVSYNRGQRLLFNEQQHFFYFIVPLSHQWVPYTVHGTHKCHISATFSLKMDPTILFIHLKIILLQCFQFQFSISTTISSIQTNPFSQLKKIVMKVSPLKFEININLKSRFQLFWAMLHLHTSCATCFSFWVYKIGQPIIFDSIQLF